MFRDLEEPVNQLTRSLSDFAEMLNESGFSNIVSRFQGDLKKYEHILTEIRDNNLKINSEILEKIKVEEKALNDDETDLFKIENITRAQSVFAGPVIMALGLASNKTKELLEAEEDATNPGVPVSQDNDTVIVITTEETSTTTTITTSTAEVSTEEVVTETSTEASADTVVTEEDDGETTETPGADREGSLATAQEVLEHHLGRSHESDDESTFETPIQTPDLSDID